MISFALLTGLYSYGIFFLGIEKLLTAISLCSITIIYLLSLLSVFCYAVKKYSITLPILSKKSIFLVILLFSLMCINLIGVLGPEYSFDALWYHLVFPKLYLLNNAVFYIPGGLLYYSAMPKLGEMLFIPALAFHSEIAAKGIQFVFGILICSLLYKQSRSYYSQFLSLLVVVIFYSNIVIAWESTVAYIDLIRTFYEFLALILFVRWQKNNNYHFLLLSSVVLGFAISTKLLALGSLVILSCMLFFISYQKKRQYKEAFLKTCIYISIALIIPLPWFIFSYISTGNPFYPFFTPIYPTHASFALVNPFGFLTDIFTIFTKSADPVSPVYLLLLPFLLLWPKFNHESKLVAFYSLCSLILWYVTPRTGGGRFMVAYLPALSLVCGEVLYQLSTYRKYTQYYFVCTTLILIIALSTLFYRAVAVSRYIPYILGKESKQTFLTRHLNFSFGDFIDINRNIERLLKPSDVVLLIGFHNLYYVNFSFVDISYVTSGQRFTYIATQHTTLPVIYENAKKVYEEPKTGVILYYVGEKRWGIQ